MLVGRRNLCERGKPLPWSKGLLHISVVGSGRGLKSAYVRSLAHVWCRDKKIFFGLAL